jgi:hypothetical protein
MTTNPDIYTDFRTLCAEPLQPLAEYDGANPYHEHRDLITRARFALAEAPEEMDLEANFRAWYEDVHGSPYFGAMPLCVAIKWAQHLLQQAVPPAPEVGEGRWSEGVCGDGAAILFDGVMIPIEEVVQALNRAPAAPPAPEVGEVGELVAALKEPGDPFPEYRTITSEQADRIAALLQQQQHLLGLACAELDRFMEKQPLNVIFTGPPGPGNDCVFVEVETDDGRSVKAGEWSQRQDGYWALRLSNSITSPGSSEVTDDNLRVTFIEGAGMWLNDDVLMPGLRLIADRFCSAPTPAGVPVAVSERLPGPEDCDEDGFCWMGYGYKLPGVDEKDSYAMWMLMPSEESSGEVWRPAHAIPLPHAEGA